jgi:predicted dehydrogenase
LLTAQRGDTYDTHTLKIHSSESKQMNETIGIGIVGTGFARTTQLPAFRATPGARVVAIASGHRENAERVAREFDIPFVAEDWRAIVEHTEVDLVCITTPPVTHQEMTLTALDFNKAVLCEKPTALNADEARAMLARAEEKNALALIDHELRFLRGRQIMRDLVRAGEIGRVRHAKFTFRADSRAVADRSWDWWSDERAGGGVLGAIGSHAVDALRWLLDTEVTRVSAQLATHVRARTDERTGTSKRVTTDDEANLLISFADGEFTQGTTGAIALSMVESGQPEHRVELYGEQGALMIAEPEELYRAQTGAHAWERVEVLPTELAPGLRDGSWSRGFTNLASALVAAMQAGARQVAYAATFTDGYRNQLVLDAARRAHESGRWVNVEQS